MIIVRGSGHSFAIRNLRALVRSASLDLSLYSGLVNLVSVGLGIAWREEIDLEPII